MNAEPLPNCMTLGRNFGKITFVKWEEITFGVSAIGEKTCTHAEKEFTIVKKILMGFFHMCAIHLPVLSLRRSSPNLLGLKEGLAGIPVERFECR